MQFVCPTCGYPSLRPEQGCDNPACLENPTLSESFKAALMAREAKARADREEDERRLATKRRLRAAGFTTC